MAINSEKIKQLSGPILVLGGSGFIGARIFQSLFAIRNDVFATASKLPAWRLDSAPSKHVLEIQLLNAHALEDLLDEIKPATIFNCLAYGAYSFQTDPERIYTTNFGLTQRLLELLSQKFPQVTYVHAGSQSEYGLNCTAPKENDELIPNSHYAVSKASSAQLIKYYGKTRNMRCCNLRLYSAYGPLEDSSRLIPSLIKAASNKEYPPFANPEISRDFVYVDDVCEAFIHAALFIEPSLFGDSFNIGTGKKTTLRDLAFAAQKIFHIDSNPTFGSFENRAWDVSEWYAAPKKAEQALRWKAETSLEDGLQKMMNWYQNLSDHNAYQENSKSLLAQKNQRTITALIACYKDELAIPIMHEELTKVFLELGIDYEIIFVNDGSPDQSQKVIESISARDPKVIGITHSRNFGSQAAFISGMEIASMNSCVLMDGDLQDPPHVIKSFYEKWCEGFDVVYGRRVKREAPIYMQLAYKLFYVVFNKFSYVYVPRDAGDFSLIDRRVVRWLISCEERDLFLRGLRAYVGFKQTGVDYIRPERRFGRTTNNLLKNIGWAKKGILSFSNVPLNVLSFCGVVLFMAGVLLSFLQILGRIYFPEITPRGFTSMLLVVVTLGGCNLLAIALIGEYIAKIFDEVKQRPRFIRKHRIKNGQITDWN